MDVRVLRKYKCYQEAESVRLKREQLEGTLVDRAEWERAVSGLLTAISRELKQLPARLASRVADKLALSPSDRQVVEHEGMYHARRITESLLAYIRSQAIAEGAASEEGAS